MIPCCVDCGALLGERHVACGRYSGQVLPSEIPGYIRSVVRDVSEVAALRAELAAMKARRDEAVALLKEMKEWSGELKVRISQKEQRAGLAIFGRTNALIAKVTP